MRRPPTACKVSLVPSKANLQMGDTQQFRATVTNTTDPSVKWSIEPSAGSVSSDGLYTAPSILSKTQKVNVTATSVLYPDCAATAAITIKASTTVSVSPASAQLTPAQSRQFTATVNGTTGAAVNWKVSPVVGSVSSTGLYTAPSTLSSSQTVTVTATSAVDATATASATVEIVADPNPLAVITASLPDGTVGASYSASVLVSGGTAPYTFSLLGQLPVGLSLSASGSLSGTPLTAGSSSLTIQVQDSGGQTASQAYTLSVAAPFSIVTTSLPAGVVGNPYSTTIAATGGTAPYTFLVGLPQGLSLSATTGQISGTPSIDGAYTLTVEATDAGGRKATKSLGLVIAAVLAITTTSLPDGAAGVAYVGAVAAMGGTAPLSWAVDSGQLPAGLGLDPATGAITGRPGTGGAYTFSAQVRDSREQQARRTLTIAVTGGGASPSILTNSLHLGYIQQPYSAVMTAAGGAAPYTWSLAAGQLPAGLALAADSGKITGTPTAGGQFSGTIAVTDSVGASTSKAFTLEVFERQTDKYGGLVSNPCPNGPKEHFYTQKVGDRWSLCTPDGNQFWMRGVYYVTGNGWTDELKSSWDARAGAKYGDQVWPAQLLRLSSWGFNTLGPGTYAGVLPMNQSVTKLPFVNGYSYVNPGIACVENFPYVKNIYKGISVPIFGSNGAKFPDVFDPAFTTGSDAFFKADATTNGNNLYNVKDSAYMVGYMGEDTDFLNGFGAGPDFTNDPPGKWGAHLAFVALVASPTQATNPYKGGAAYSDTTFYTKSQLVRFLTAKYIAIGALNTAWGSSYTTWGTQGAGWGSGTGLLDEDGRASHTWLGTPDLGLLTGMNANVKADLDSFLYEIAKKYFQVTKASFQAVAPGQLYFGPTNIGGAGWRVPGRCPVLRAAGEILDVTNIGSDLSPEQRAWTATCVGDHPIAIWEGETAQADSGRYRRTATSIWGTPNPTWNKTTQAARGALFQSDVTSLVNDGQYVGYLFWQFLDNSSEQTNWGLISLAGNAYDGKEARVAGGMDSWGYPTGGEEGDYGDFITSVKEANLGVNDVLAPLAPVTAKTLRFVPSASTTAQRANSR